MCGMAPLASAPCFHDKAVMALERSSSLVRLPRRLREPKHAIRSMPNSGEGKGAPLNPSGNQLSAIIRCIALYRWTMICVTCCNICTLLAAFQTHLSRCCCMCRRKQQQVEQQIKELGMDSLQERLEDAAQTPAKPPYRLATLIQVSQALHCIAST